MIPIGDFMRNNTASDCSARVTYVPSLDDMPRELHECGLFVSLSIGRIIGAWTATRSRSESCVAFCQVPRYINSTSVLGEFITSLAVDELDSLLWDAFNTSIHGNPRGEISLGYHLPQIHGYRFVIFFIVQMERGTIGCVGATRADLIRGRWNLCVPASPVSVIQVSEGPAWYDDRDITSTNGTASMDEMPPLPTQLWQHLKDEIDVATANLPNEQCNIEQRTIVETCIGACENLANIMARVFDIDAQTARTTHLKGISEESMCG